jgi:hypothetical protein
VAERRNKPLHARTTFYLWTEHSAFSALLLRQARERQAQMEAKLDRLLRGLRDLSKSYDRLSRAVPDPKEAEHNADAALQAVLASLQDPEIIAVIENLIPAAREHILSDPAAFQQELLARREELVKVEARVVQHSGTRRIDIETLYVKYAKVSLASEYVADANGLREQLLAIHEGAKQQIAASREQPRVEKKKRKRNVALGITSAIIGTAVIAANIPLPLVFGFSYALGGGAFHQAFRDIVGTPE